MLQMIFFHFFNEKYSAPTHSRFLTLKSILQKVKNVSTEKEIIRHHFNTYTHKKHIEEGEKRKDLVSGKALD